MREIDGNDVAVPGDLRLRSDEETIANAIISVSGMTAWLSLWFDGTITLQQRQFRPTYCVWRPACEA